MRVVCGVGSVWCTPFDGKRFFLCCDDVGRAVIVPVTRICITPFNRCVCCPLSVLILPRLSLPLFVGIGMFTYYFVWCCCDEAVLLCGRDKFTH